MALIIQKVKKQRQFFYDFACAVLMDPILKFRQVSPTTVKDRQKAALKAAFFVFFPAENWVSEK
ncbi:MAG: hypothetical protein KTR23_15835 [Rhodospirillales bacterium]|nr:hypothetical protein [Rhodospirillales bacterium]